MQTNLSHYSEIKQDMAFHGLNPDNAELLHNIEGEAQIRQ